MYGKCAFCNKAFERDPNEILFLCEECRIEEKCKKWLFSHFARDRLITADLCDAWADPDFTQRVCRVCGVEPVKGPRRHCKKHSYDNLKQILFF